MRDANNDVLCLNPILFRYSKSNQNSTKFKILANMNFYTVFIHLVVYFSSIQKKELELLFDFGYGDPNSLTTFNQRGLSCSTNGSCQIGWLDVTIAQNQIIVRGKYLIKMKVDYTERKLLNVPQNHALSLTSDSTQAQSPALVDFTNVPHTYLTVEIEKAARNSSKYELCIEVVFVTSIELTHNRLRSTKSNQKALTPAEYFWFGSFKLLSFKSNDDHIDQLNSVDASQDIFVQTKLQKLRWTNNFTMFESQIRKQLLKKLEIFEVFKQTETIQETFLLDHISFNVFYNYFLMPSLGLLSLFTWFPYIKKFLRTKANSKLKTNSVQLLEVETSIDVETDKLITKIAKLEEENKTAQEEIKELNCLLEDLHREYDDKCNEQPLVGGGRSIRGTLEKNMTSRGRRRNFSSKSSPGRRTRSPSIQSVFQPTNLTPVDIELSPTTSPSPSSRVSTSGTGTDPEARTQDTQLKALDTQMKDVLERWNELVTEEKNTIEKLNEVRKKKRELQVKGAQSKEQMIQNLKKELENESEFRKKLELKVSIMENRVAVLEGFLPTFESKSNKNVSNNNTSDNKD